MGLCGAGTLYGTILAAPGEWQPQQFPTSPHVTIENASSGPGSWILRLSAESIWREDVTAEVHVNLQPGEDPTALLWPKWYGTFERVHIEQESYGEFRGAGCPARALPDEDRLALPLAVIEASQGIWLAGTDPEFSTTMTVRRANDGQAWLVFSWTWLASAGVHAHESRRLFIQPAHDVRVALDRWFALATPDVPQGPAWLHEIALQDYDYFSNDGQGWYADIDAACKMIAPQDRHRALFCLHGWYDQIGRYSYNAATGQLDENWMVFPQIHHLDLLASMNNNTPVHAGLPTPDAYTFRNLQSYHPVPLSWQGMRDRLRYAKERGFRTAVYALTGMQDAGEKDQHIMDGTGLEITCPLWQGPDMLGPTYIMNPLHPTIRSTILGYIQALLERVGDLTDALVMDEAYYIGLGTLGPQTAPGYADRAQLRLIREMAALCHQYRPDLAFLTADLLGHPGHIHDAFPYSLGADGIYRIPGAGHKPGTVYVYPLGAMSPGVAIGRPLPISPLPAGVFRPTMPLSLLVMGALAMMWAFLKWSQLSPLKLPTSGACAYARNTKSPWW